MLVRGLKLVISSTAASTVDFMTLAALVGLAHVAAGVAALIGCLLGGAVNFGLNRRWVFRARGPGSLGQGGRYFLFVVLGGAVLVGGLVHLAVQQGAPVYAARLAVALLVLFAWNYPVSKHVVFREDRVP
jgi:putative flippase GtrA